MDPRTADRLVAVCIAIGLFVTSGWFFHTAPGWNVSSRLATVFAVVEQGTLRIDGYHQRPGTVTGDKAVIGDRVYSDKPPLLSLCGVPVYGALLAVRETFGVGSGGPKILWVWRSRYVVRLFTVGLATALLGALLFRLARAFGCHRRVSFALATGLILGTPLVGYATVFFPYLPAASCSLGAYLLLRGRHEEERSGLVAAGRLPLAGLLVAAACLFDYTLGIVAVGLAGYAAWRHRSRSRALLSFLAAAAVAPLAVAAYSLALFGELTLPYAYEAHASFRAGMAGGFQGIGWPRLRVLGVLAVHPFKGLFLFSPLLLLWLASVSRLLRRRGWRHLGADLLLSLFVVVGYLLFNSAYYLWWGGWATAPRLLLPALPFAAAPLATWAAAQGRRGRSFLYSVVLLSVALSVPVAAVDPQLSPGLDSQTLVTARIPWSASPTLHQIYPRFLSGDLTLNAGEVLLGLSGLWGLAPLATLWCLVGWIVWALAPSEPKASH